MRDSVVLCVDDEPNILSALTRLLRPEGYHFITASSASEGLLIMEKQPVHMVISDQRMPDMSGLEFLSRVKERRPDTVRMVLTGYADINIILDAINKDEVYRFLTKPWNDDELKITIRQGLHHYDLVQMNRSLIEQLRFRGEELRYLLEKIVMDRQVAQEMLDGFPLSFLIVDDHFRLLFANETFGETFPFSRESLEIGTPLAALLPEASGIAERILTEGPAPFPFFKITTPRPSWLWVEPIRESGSANKSLLMLKPIDLGD